MKAEMQVIKIKDLDFRVYGEVATTVLNAPSEARELTSLNIEGRSPAEESSLISIGVRRFVQEHAEVLRRLAEQ
jgi:hypothetical protein